MIPLIFEHLMVLYAKNQEEKSFSLTNRDSGVHSILVNEDFETVGVIDCDGVMAGPVEMVARFSVLTGLEPEAPGHLKTRPMAIFRIEWTKPVLEEYQSLIRSAEANMCDAANRSVHFAEFMAEDRASILQGLLAYGGHQGFFNDMWMKAYSRLLWKYVASLSK